MSLSQKDIITGRANGQIGTQMVKQTASMSIWHLRLAPGERLVRHRQHAELEFYENNSQSQKIYRFYEIKQSKRFTLGNIIDY